MKYAYLLILLAFSAHSMDDDDEKKTDTIIEVDERESTEYTNDLPRDLKLTRPRAESGSTSERSTMGKLGGSSGRPPASQFRKSNKEKKVPRLDMIPSKSSGQIPDVSVVTPGSSYRIEVPPGTPTPKQIDSLQTLSQIGKSINTSFKVPKRSPKESPKPITSELKRSNNSIEIEINPNTITITPQVMAEATYFLVYKANAPTLDDSQENNSLIRAQSKLRHMARRYKHMQTQEPEKYVQCTRHMFNKSAKYSGLTVEDRKNYVTSKQSSSHTPTPIKTSHKSSSSHSDSPNKKMKKLKEEQEQLQTQMLEAQATLRQEMNEEIEKQQEDIKKLMGEIAKQADDDTANEIAREGNRIQRYAYYSNFALTIGGIASGIIGGFIGNYIGNNNAQCPTSAFNGSFF